MTLVKKTIILAKNGAKGYLTVVRVGSSIGIKVVIDYQNEELLMGLKIGSGNLIVEKINASKTEFEVNEKIDFKNSDDISCIIISGNQIYAEGGLRGRVNIQDIIQYINKQNANLENFKEVGHGEDKGVFQEIERADSKVDRQDSSDIQAEDRREITDNKPIKKEELKENLNVETKKVEEIKAKETKKVIKDDAKTQTVKETEKPKSEKVLPKAEPKKVIDEITKPEDKIIEEVKTEKMEKQPIKQQPIQEEKTEKLEEKLRENTKNIPKDAKSFYYSVKDKLDELFVMYPREELLEKIIPSSKWVKINYDKEDYYVAGVLIDDNNKVTHIAYGVPGLEGKTPPKETECICDWLPIKNMNRYQGYWLIFQSADTGEILPKD